MQSQLFLAVVLQLPFLIVELAQSLEVLLVLPAAPMVRERNSGLKLRDFVIKFSRWVLGPKIIPTVVYRQGDGPTRSAAVLPTRCPQLESRSVAMQFGGFHFPDEHRVIAVGELANQLTLHAPKTILENR